MLLKFTNLHEHHKKEINIPVVVDFNLFDEIVGIEILNMKLLTNPKILNFLDSINLQYSYDIDNDAFYLKIKNDKSIDQKSTQAKLLLNEENQMIAIDIQN